MIKPKIISKKPETPSDVWDMAAREGVTISINSVFTSGDVEEAIRYGARCREMGMAPVLEIFATVHGNLRPE